jgi:hypothetical protein
MDLRWNNLGQLGGRAMLRALDHNVTLRSAKLAIAPSFLAATTLARPPVIVTLQSAKLAIAPSLLQLQPHAVVPPI